MIEDLLADLAASGWKLSWAFQFAPNHWRVCITHEHYWNGYDQPDYHYTDCADAPSFAEALEDAMAKRNDAIFVEGAKVEYALEPQQSLAKALGLDKPKPQAPIARRF